MTRKEKMLLAFILLFLGTLFFPWVKLVNIVAVSLLCFYSFFLFNSFPEKRKLFQIRRYVWWMLLFFGLVVISVLLSSDFHKGLRYLDPRMSLIYFPLSIGLIETTQLFRRRVLVSFSYLTVAVMVLCLLYGVYRSDLFRHNEFLYNDSLTQILGQQSIYISLLVNFSIYILADRVFRGGCGLRAFNIVCIVFLYVISYLLASRNMMIVVYLFTFGVGLFYILRKKRYVAGMTLIAALLAGIVMVFTLFPKTLNRYRELVFTNYNYERVAPESHYNMEVTKDQWNGVNFRLAAWSCGWELFIAHPMMGVHLGDKKDALMQKYREKNFRFAIFTKKNVHNNYLDILYSMGLIGLIVFVIGWVVAPIIRARETRDYLSAAMIITIALAWITEIYFDRSIGAMLTGFFIPFLLSGERNKSESILH